MYVYPASLCSELKRKLDLYGLNICEANCICQRKLGTDSKKDFWTSFSISNGSHHKVCKYVCHNISRITNGPE